VTSEVASSVRAALLSHTHVRRVTLVGSRATGRATRLSDWDFVVEVASFPPVAADLAGLVGPLEPIAQQWDRLSSDYCYMLILRGPVKVDLMFDQACEQLPPWEVGPATLVAIDQHFWDWALWMGSKRLAGNDALVSTELRKMFEHLLQPVGVHWVPETLDDAIADYRIARARLESEFGVVVPRLLEEEVTGALRLVTAASEASRRRARRN
jgi:hypothetical protein